MYLLGKALFQRIVVPKLARVNFSSLFSAKKWQPIRIQLKQLTTKPTPATPGAPTPPAPQISFPFPLPKHHKLIGYWLLSTAGFVYCTVILGGYTRLTESGLSMVEWNLIRDMRPPQSEEEWQREFEKYQQFPEYKHKCDIDKMTLEQFKNIYYFEFVHRLFGRFVGTWFFLPAALFWARGFLTPHLKRRILVLGALVAAQGAMGWYMVKSGLKETENVPRVSAYRLASHLGLALFLYAISLWNGLSLVLPQVRIPDSKLYTFLRRRCAHPLMLIIFTTAMSGAFVAGLDAGLGYNSWPKMADRWVPSDLVTMEPFWKNIFENPTMAQFNHRRLGEITFFAVLAMYLAARRIPGLHPRARMALNAMMAMACVQVGLGITTLLTFVDIHVAASHQGGALGLLGCAVWFANEIRRWKLPIK